MFQETTRARESSCFEFWRVFVVETGKQSTKERKREFEPFRAILREVGENRRGLNEKASLGS